LEAVKRSARKRGEMIRRKDETILQGGNEREGEGSAQKKGGGGKYGPSPCPDHSKFVPNAKEAV